MQALASDAPVERDGHPAAGRGELAAFVSYSHRDAAYVELLVRALEALGRDVWMDEDDIPPGAPWRKELGTAIEAADAFLFILSPESVVSPECAAELARAVEIGKRLVVVEHRPVERPPPALADIQWIRGDDVARVAEDVCRAIDTDHDHVRAHTLWLSRALRWDEHGRERSQLLRGRELDAADAWLTAAQRRHPPPTRVQAEFVAAGRRAQRVRTQRIIAAIVVALGVAVGLAVVAVVQRNTAERERRVAEARELAASALLTLGEDPELSLILAARAAGIDPNAQVEDALRQGLLASRVRATLSGHAQGLTAVAVSPDGTTVATASEDRTARIWRADGGPSLHVLRGHEHPITGLELDARGRRLVTFAQDYTARVWDVRTGRALAVLRDPDDYRLQDAAISPDGRLVATAPFVHGRIRIWDVATARTVRTLSQSTINDVEFSPDGRLLLSTDQEETARLWDVATGSTVGVLRGHRRNYVWRGAFSPDGARAATVGEDGTARIWDVGTGRALAVLRGHRAPVTTVDFSPDGARLLTAADDRTARVWDAGSGRLRAELTHDAMVTSAAFDGDGRLVATTDVDGATRVWRASDGRLAATLRGHHGPVRDAAFGPDARVVTAGADGTARVWDAAPGSPGLAQASTRVLGRAVTVSTPAGRVLLAHAEAWNPGGDCGALVLSSARPLGPCVQSHEREVLTVSDDGRRIVTAPFGGDGRVHVEDARTGRIRVRLAPVDLERRAVDAAFARDGRVALALDDGTAEIWSPGGRRLRVVRAADEGPSLLTDHGGVTSVRFSPDGTSLLTASDDRSVRVLDAATGRQRMRLEGFPPQVARIEPIARAAYSPDGRRILGFTAWSDTALIWDSATGRRVAELRGHANPVTSAVVSTDGRFALTTDLQDARLWDAVSGRLLAVLGQAEPYRGPSLAVFLRDGRSIALFRPRYEQNGQLLVYDCAICGGVPQLAALAEERITRRLSTAERARYLHEEGA